MSRVPVPIYAVVLILVEDDGRYVLIQEAMPERGYPWFIPAGVVEPGESIVEATKRETLEEAGLAVEPRYLLRIEHFIPHGQDQRHPAAELWRYVIAAEATGGKLKTTADEHSLQARWFRPEELGGLKLRSDEVFDLIEMHRQGAPALPIEAYVSRLAHLR
ncbi:MAG TPA: NUDIX domain-containing protein [Anaerolineae bacterium]|nr:NUDIX domain-containing protein [Anaerolineae bacterium]